MSERYYAIIYIPTARIDEELAIEIADYQFEEEYEDDGVSSYGACHAKYGEYEDLENMLRRKKVPYTRQTEAFMGAPARETHYRPDVSPEPLDIFVSSDHGEYYVLVEKLQPLLDLHPYEAMFRLKALLDEHAPDIKPLTAYAEEG